MIDRPAAVTAVALMKSRLVSMSPPVSPERSATLPIELSLGNPSGIDPVERGYRRRQMHDGTGRVPRPAAPEARSPALLTLDRRAGSLELLLGLVGLLTGHALEHGARRAVDEILGLLEAKARERADLLDDL